jgi:hypothetical protein
VSGKRVGPDDAGPGQVTILWIQARKLHTPQITTQPWSDGRIFRVQRVYRVKNRQRLRYMVGFLSTRFYATYCNPLVLKGIE